jgi:hypothetical protein
MLLWLACVYVAPHGPAEVTPYSAAGCAPCCSDIRWQSSLVVQCFLTWRTHNVCIRLPTRRRRGLCRWRMYPGFAVAHNLTLGGGCSMCE